MDCSLPGFSVHGISQARILEWVAISSSNWPSQPRDWTSIPCTGRQILYHWAKSTIFQLGVGWGSGLILVSQSPLQLMGAVMAKDKSVKVPWEASLSSCIEGHCRHLQTGHEMWMWNPSLIMELQRETEWSRVSENIIKQLNLHSDGYLQTCSIRRSPSLLKPFWAQRWPNVFEPFPCNKK